MNFQVFGQSGCARARQHMDSYISSELLVESTIELLRHLQQCRACSLELDARMKIRASLQAAGRRVATPPDLDRTIRRQIRAIGPLGFRQFGPSARWMSLAAVLSLTSIASWITWRSINRPGSQTPDAFVLTLASDLPAILQIGLRDHVRCAVLHKYPEDPPAFAEMADALGPQYAGLLPLVEAEVPKRFRVIMAHHCQFEGRNYVHLVLRSPSSLLSVILTTKRPGESFAAGQFVPLLQASGVPVYSGVSASYQVAEFEADAHLAFVISDLPAESNLGLTAILAPPIHRFLSRLQTRS
jgi:hypothetical protein